MAAQQREAFRFGQTTAEDILTKYGHKDEVVLIQSKRYSQSPLEVATLAHKEGDLLPFIKQNILPLVGEITNDNQAHYHGRDLPLVKIYSDLNWQLNSKGANYLLNKIRRVCFLLLPISTRISLPAYFSIHPSLPSTSTFPRRFPFSFNSPQHFPLLFPFTTFLLLLPVSILFTFIQSLSSRYLLI